MNNITKLINLTLTEEQTRTILKSLELYSFNMHNVWGIKKDEEEYQFKNSIVFHTYEQIMSSIHNDFLYSTNYNIKKECEHVNKKRFYYNNQKKIAK